MGFYNFLQLWHKGSILSPHKWNANQQSTDRNSIDGRGRRHNIEVGFLFLLQAQMPMFNPLGFQAQLLPPQPISCPTISRILSDMPDLAYINSKEWHLPRIWHKFVTLIMFLNVLGPPLSHLGDKDEYLSCFSHRGNGCYNKLSRNESTILQLGCTLELLGIF